MLQQYIEFFYPGSFFPETTKRPVDDRRPIASPPDGVYGYRFFAREEVRQGGEVLSGKEKDYSGMTYFGDVLTADDIEKLPGDHKTLLINMWCNNWPRVVCTVRGNFQPLQDADMCVSLPK